MSNTLKQLNSFYLQWLHILEFPGKHQFQMFSHVVPVQKLLFERQSPWAWTRKQHYRYIPSGRGNISPLVSFAPHSPGLQATQLLFSKKVLLPTPQLRGPSSVCTGKLINSHCLSEEPEAQWLPHSRGGTKIHRWRAPSPPANPPAPLSPTVPVWSTTAGNGLGFSIMKVIEAQCRVWKKHRNLGEGRKKTPHIFLSPVNNCQHFVCISSCSFLKHSLFSIAVILH